MLLITQQIFETRVSYYLLSLLKHRYNLHQQVKYMQLDFLSDLSFSHFLLLFLFESYFIKNEMLPIFLVLIPIYSPTH